MKLLQIRIDDVLKAEAAQVLDQMGLDLSSADRMFLHKIVEERRIPFPITCTERLESCVEEEPAPYYGKNSFAVDRFMQMLLPLSRDVKLMVIARLSESLLTSVPQDKLTMEEAQKLFSKDWGGSEDARTVAGRLRKTRKNVTKSLDW